MTAATSGITDHAIGEALDGYRSALSRTKLALGTQRKYAQRVADFLGWLAASDCDGDPLSEPTHRDWAVRDYRAHLKVTKRQRPGTINNALGAIDDFYRRRGLGESDAGREDVAQRTAPKALSPRDTQRFLRAVEAEGKDDRHQARRRDVVTCLLPYYAGLRIAEVVKLNREDIWISARKGEIRVLGKGRNGGKERTLKIHEKLRRPLEDWISERPTWPGGHPIDSGPFLLNRRGERLSDRSARAIITEMGGRVGLGDDEPFGPHVLRHTFATRLVREGVDLVTVGKFLGHAYMDTTKIYSLPTDEDEMAALDKLVTEE